MAENLISREGCHRAVLQAIRVPVVKACNLERTQKRKKKSHDCYFYVAFVPLYFLNNPLRTRQR
eukprot:11848700-Ditylum_brightwellii.AAC.1